MTFTAHNKKADFSYRQFYILRYLSAAIFIILAGVFPSTIILAITLILVIFAVSGAYSKLCIKLFGPEYSNVVSKNSISGGFIYFSLLIFIGLIALIVFEKFSSENLIFILFQSIAITILDHNSTYAIVFNKEMPAKVDENGLSSTTNHFPLFYEMVLIFLRFFTAFLISLWFLRYTTYVSTTGGLSLLFFISIIGTLAGSLFETIRSDLSKDTSVFVGTLLTIIAFFLFEYAAPFSQTLAVVLFSLFLAILAFWVGIADFSALLSAAILGIIIILFSDLEWFILLLMFFILGGAFTKYKFEYKRKRGISEGKSGIRNYVNVFANSLTAMILAIMFGVVQLYPEKSYLAIPITFGFVGSVANATGDTLASEVGATTNGQTYMITTLKKVKPGQDGGISLLGEIACLGGSFIIGISAYLFGMIEPLGLALLVSFTGGFIGTNIDSLLGAIFQNRGYLSNSEVNLISTSISAILCSLLYFVLF